MLAKQGIFMTSRILVVGNSHVFALMSAAKLRPDSGRFTILRWDDKDKGNEMKSSGAEVRKEVSNLGQDDLLVLMNMGNRHNVLGLLQASPAFSVGDAANGETMIPTRAMENALTPPDQHREETREILAMARSRVVMVAPPPVKGDNEFILNNTGGRQAGDIAAIGVSPAPLRKSLRKLEIGCLARFAEDLGIDLLPEPNGATTSDGYMAPKYFRKDAMHANVAYGHLVLDQLVQYAGREPHMARSFSDGALVELDGFWIPAKETKRYGEMGRYEGIPEQDVIKLKRVVDMVEPRSCALDIGANIGTTAALLSLNFDRVHAFEPSPDLFTALERNIAKHPHAAATQCAIGEEIGEVFLTQYTKHGQISHLSSGQPINGAKYIKVGPIPLRTIDSFYFQDVSFIKIDVEGFEGPVVRGAAETIKRCRPAILVEQAGNEQKCFGLPLNEASTFLESLGMVEHPNAPRMSKDRLFVFPNGL
jgi:FkbM family methyltransferase